jgi:hypothetical protein
MMGTVLSTNSRFLQQPRGVSEERVASIIRVKGISYVEKLAVTSNYFGVEGLGKLKKRNTFTSTGFEPATFRLVA